MHRDISDIIDRLSIAQLKKERIGSEENKKEYQAFKEAFDKIKKDFPQYNWEQFYNFIKDINNFIWQFEAASKSGKEELPDKNYILSNKNKEVLAKLGIVNLLIKNYNHLRIGFKNIINKLMGEGFIDIKRKHLSE